MAEKIGPGELPGNHGQFGRNIATEEYKPLENRETEDRASSSPAPVPPLPTEDEGAAPCG